MRKKCYLDANVLVYFIDGESLLHAKAEALVVELSETFDFVISPMCLDEFLYVVKFALAKKFGRQKMWAELHEALKAILTIPNLAIAHPPSATEKQIAVVALMKKYNLSPRDAYHLFTAICNEINRFATFDIDFIKSSIKEITVVTK